MSELDDIISALIEAGDPFSLNNAAMLAIDNATVIDIGTIHALYRRLFQSRLYDEIAYLFHGSGVIPPEPFITGFVDDLFCNHAMVSSLPEKIRDNVLQTAYQFLIHAGLLGRFIGLYQRYCVDPQESLIYAALACCESHLKAGDRATYEELGHALCDAFNFPHHLINNAGATAMQ